jgi:hypothetical protein
MGNRFRPASSYAIAESRSTPVRPLIARKRGHHDGEKKNEDRDCEDHQNSDAKLLHGFGEFETHAILHPQHSVRQRRLVRMVSENYGRRMQVFNAHFWPSESDERATAIVFWANRKIRTSNQALLQPRTSYFRAEDTRHAQGTL